MAVEFGGVAMLLLQANRTSHNLKVVANKGKSPEEATLIL